MLDGNSTHSQRLRLAIVCLVRPKIIQSGWGLSMASQRGRPPGRSAAAGVTAAKDFQNLNATTAAFLGGRPKDWMNTSIDTGPAKSVFPTSTVKTSAITAVPQSHEAIRGNGSPLSPFPISDDRGCSPLQRRHGGTKIHSARQSTSSGSVAAPISPRADIKAPVVFSKEITDDTGNSLPSPNPSIETRRQSTIIVDLENEDEAVEKQASGNELRSRLEELVAQNGGIDTIRKILLEFGSSENVSEQRAQSPVMTPIVQSDGPADSSADFTAQHGPSEIQEPSTTSHNEVRAASVMNKRRSESGQAPRKRVQGAPNSSKHVVRITNSGSNSPIVTSNPAVTDTSGLSASIGEQMRGFEHNVLLRIHSSKTNGRAVNPVERPRLDLLREACQRLDYLYLCLHQIYCLDHQRQRLEKRRSVVAESAQKGLDKIAYLLVPNEGLSSDAVMWFSDFPLPLNVLLSGNLVWRQGYQKALQCLTLFARNWDLVRSQCELRRYPPLIDELVKMFGGDSFILHQVIYRALLRDIWLGPQDQCFRQADEMFQRYYQEAMERRLANTAIDHSVASAETFTTQYRLIAQAHGLHTHQQQSGGSMPPPHQSRPNLVPRQNIQHDPHQHGSRQDPSYRRASSSSSETQRQDPRFGFPVTQVGSPAAPTQASHIFRPTFQQSPGHSPHQDAATGIFVIPQNAVPSSMPVVAPTSRHGGDHRHSMNLDQSPRSVTYQKIPPRDQRLSISIPSEGTNRSAHTRPQGFPAPSNLPRNNSGSDLRQSQQTPRPQYPETSHAHPQYTDAAHLFDGSGHQYGMNEQSLQGNPQVFSSPVAVTPFIRANPNLSQLQINPLVNALHQTHVRSPVLSSYALQGKGKATKFFRHIERVIISPMELSNARRHISWDFNVEKVIYDTVAKDLPGSYGSLSMRVLLPNSRHCRIRCVKIAHGVKLLGESEWVVAEHIWPVTTAMVLNNEALEIRRKSHHGKDLPIDATPYLQEGQNRISAAVIGFSEDASERYAIGVEIITVVDEESIKAKIPVTSMQDARQHIINNSGTADPDIQVLNSQIILDLTDPFTASIFNVPIRGKSCRHSQCFDRDVFFQTRGSAAGTGNNNKKAPPDPCSPDEFKCPICGLDARPQSLAIDGFFVHVREALERKGRVDVKAITLDPQTGDWQIKEEDEGLGEQGDGTGSKSARARQSVGRQSTPRDVIRIRDDN